MEENFKCSYCSFWVQSPVIGRDDATKKTKFIRRVCPASLNKVSADHDSCEYFNPASIFYCDLNNHRLTLLECMNRRRNSKGFQAWKKCKRCRQFNNDIKPILEDYFFDCRKVKEVPIETAKKSGIKRRKKSKIKRRKSKPSGIKRRKKKPVKIKRRKKGSGKIKRRK